MYLPGGGGIMKLIHTANDTKPFKRLIVVSSTVYTPRALSLILDRLVKQQDGILRFFEDSGPADTPKKKPYHLNNRAFINQSNNYIAIYVYKWFVSMTAELWRNHL